MLVLQWSGASVPASPSALIRIEKRVAKLVGSDGLVDGHDLGSGEANIFVLTSEDPAALFRKIEEAAGDWIRESGLAKAGWRTLAAEDPYTVIWPAGATELVVK